MATETLVPSGGGAGWPTGTSDNIDNTIAGADGAYLETSIKDDFMTLDMNNVVDITDSDTVNSLTIRVHMNDTGSGGKNTFDVDPIIAAVGRGVSSTPNLTNTTTTYDLTNAGWDSDWSVSDLNGMSLQCTSRQAGMPTSADWQLDEIEVVIDYTPAAGAPGPEIFKRKLNTLLRM